MEDKELLQAKIDLRKIIIEEEGEKAYYEFIADKIKWLNEFKITADKIFGKNDNMFREEVRRTIASKDLNEDDMLFEFIITDIALDTILE